MRAAGHKDSVKRLLIAARADMSLFLLHLSSVNLVAHVILHVFAVACLFNPLSISLSIIKAAAATSVVVHDKICILSDGSEDTMQRGGFG